MSLGCREEGVPSSLPDFVPPWVSLVKVRVSQLLGLWSFESPWTCSSGGFRPPSLFGLWSGLFFLVSFRFLGRKTPQRGDGGGASIVRVAGGMIWGVSVLSFF
jgi:hypothetical protein